MACDLGEQHVEIDGLLQRPVRAHFGRLAGRVRVGSEHDGGDRTQARILQNNSVIVEGSVNKVDTSSQPDLKHIRLSGAIMLKDSLEPGDYFLQLTVFDRAGRQMATQGVAFEIVK